MCAVVLATCTCTSPASCHNIVDNGAREEKMCQLRVELCAMPSTIANASSGQLSTSTPPTHPCWPNSSPRSTDNWYTRTNKQLIIIGGTCRYCSTLVYPCRLERNRTPCRLHLARSSLDPNQPLNQALERISPHRAANKSMICPSDFAPLAFHGPIHTETGYSCIGLFRKILQREDSPCHYCSHSMCIASIPARAMHGTC